MTLPLSGPLEASDINVELGRSATAVMSIKDAATGVYATINTCSPYYPNASAPHAYSEWYGYNHLAPCLNSNFAFSPQNTGSPARFLRSDTLDYPSVVSSTRPSARSQFTLSMWIKIDSNIINTNQGYLTAFATAGSTPSFLLQLFWSSVFDSGLGVYNNRFDLNVGNATYPGFTSGVDVSDSSNTGLTGVPDGLTLDQTGFLDANGYFLLTCVVDYNYFGTSDYVSWYWNDSLLTSSTTASGPVTPNYTGYDLAVGALYTGEIASGCLIDGYALFIDKALNQADVTAIYNGGAVASIGTYTGISSNLLFYNFESANPNIGDETGGTFNFDLDEINNPRRVQPPAA